jgi:hypothetical protein
MTIDTSAVIGFLKGIAGPSSIAALISLLIGIWYQRRAAEKLEESKSLMRLFEDTSKTRFSWLYEARARAMADIYGALIEVEDNIRSFVLCYDLEPSEEAFDTVAERFHKMSKSISALDKLYRPARLLFSEKTAGDLDTISTKYHAILTEFDEQLEFQQFGFDLAFEAIAAVKKTLPDTESLIKEVARRFREIYGSEGEPDHAGR